MTTATLKIAREMKGLPIEEMMTLHQELIATIHEREEDRGLDPVYAVEIRRRVTEIKSGKAKGVDAYRAIRRM